MATDNRKISDKSFNVIFLTKNIAFNIRCFFSKKQCYLVVQSTYISIQIMIMSKIQNKKFFGVLFLDIVKEFL